MQIRFITPIPLLALLFAPLPVHAQDSASCRKCHESEDFDGMSIDKIVAKAADTSIMAHKRYGRLSEEELTAIVKALME